MECDWNAANPERNSAIKQQAARSKRPERMEFKGGRREANGIANSRNTNKLLPVKQTGQSDTESHHRPTASVALTLRARSGPHAAASSSAKRPTLAFLLLEKKRCSLTAFRGLWRAIGRDVTGVAAGVLGEWAGPAAGRVPCRRFDGLRYDELDSLPMVALIARSPSLEIQIGRAHV